MAAERTRWKLFPNGSGHPIVWSPEMLRAVITVVDARKPVTGNLDPIAEEISLAIKQLPELRRNDLPLSQIKSRLALFSRPKVDGSSHPDFLRYGSDAVNFHSLPKGILSDDEFKTWAEQFEANSQKKKPENLPSPPNLRKASAPDYKDETEDESAKHHGVQLQKNLEDQAQTSFINDTAPIALIRTEMEDIYKQICASVAERLDESGVFPDEPVWNLLLPRTQSWRELLDVMIGPEGPEFDAGLEITKNLQAKQRLTLENFMVSAIAAAATVWAFQPDSLGHFRDVGYEACLAEVRRLAPDEVSVFEQNVRSKLLREQVLPHIPDKAGALAREVDELLSVFAAPARGGHAVKARQKSGPGTGINDPSKRLNIGEPYWVVDWRQELKQIFEKALYLRIELDKKGGEYSFSFPVPGSGWDTADGESHVQIGLFPSVEGRFQAMRGGTFGRWEQLTDAQVLAVTIDEPTRTRTTETKATQTLPEEVSARQPQATEVPAKEAPAKQPQAKQPQAKEAQVQKAPAKEAQRQPSTPPRATVTKEVPVIEVPDSEQRRSGRQSRLTKKRRSHEDNAYKPNASASPSPSPTRKRTKKAR